MLGLKAEREYAEATFLQGKERDDFRMDRAFDWAHVTNALKEPFLRPDDKLFLRVRRHSLKEIRKRIRQVDARKGSIDDFDDFLETFETGLSAHVALELIQGVRARLNDPWADGMLVAQLACNDARSGECEALLSREADAYSRRMIEEPYDGDAVYGVREGTLEALRAVLRSYRRVRN